MPRAIHSGEFFVVGGPVQPDRACYIKRAADELLREGLASRRFCYVLAPKASGKTSLMARTIRALRSDDQLAAVIDLSQIGARGESAEPGRWYYSIAYRIVRELRLKVDLQTWWQQKSVLVSEQRLADFFWEIVLANTTAPVNIFFDEIERAAELPFARELFVAIAACYHGRLTEPDYQRLNFTILGVATPRQLGHGIALSLFDDGLAIEPTDFTIEESYHLAQGFDTDERQAQAVLDRIHYWVKGQPYLTQKIARAVARRHGTVEDVDNVIRGQFLTEGARDEEPLLSYISALLKTRGVTPRRALVLLGQLGKGAPIVADADSPAQALLALAGISTASDDDFLIFRNRLVKAIFTSRWVRSALPFNWRAAAIAAAAVVAMIFLPIWYTRYFPRPYIETLTSISDDYALALETHDKLRRFPGFGETANRLLADIMVQRSDGATDFAEVQAADSVLRNLAGYEPTADRLIGAYWLRRAEDAVVQGRRDAGLVYADLALIGNDPAAARLVAGLADSDYAALERSYRFAESLDQWAVDWSSTDLIAVDGGQHAWGIRADPNDPTEHDFALTALQHRPVSRELGVDEPGSASAFLLEIDIEHAAIEQLMLRLEAPSGASAVFSLSSQRASRYEIRATERSALAVLADEDRQGVWRLTLTDRQEGAEGQLARWSLLFAEELRGWEDVPDEALLIPDPVQTVEIVTQLSADGRLGVARPARADALGALTLWDLSAGVRLGDISIDGTPTYIALSPDDTRLVSVVGNVLAIWDVATRQLLGRIATQTGFALPPAIGADGEYVAIAEQLSPTSTLYSLLRAVDGELVASIEGSAGVRAWRLGPQARYLALIGPARAVRLIDPRRGQMLAELPFDVEPVAIADASESRLLTVNAAGDIVAWSLSDASAGVTEGRFVGETVDPLSISVASGSDAIAYEAEHRHVVVRDAGNGAVLFSARVPASSRPVRTRLSPDGARLVTSSAELLQVWDIERAPNPAGRRSGAADSISAMALDGTGQIVALGYRDGHLELRTPAQLSQRLDAQDDIAYIGHQGAITAIALSAMQGAIATGGRDGIVRLWDLASGAPTSRYLRHPEGPVTALTVSRDGAWVASAADDSVRIWSAASGSLEAELAVNGMALAVAIAPDATSAAVGDAAGNVFVTGVSGNAPAGMARAQAAVTALAYSPDGGMLASGDRSGHVQLWRAADVGALGPALVLPQPIRWLGFSDDGRYLTAQTDHWIHRLVVDASAQLTIDASRLFGIDRETGAPALAGMQAARLVGGRDLGFAEVEDIVWDATATPDAQAPPFVEQAPPSVEREWQRILELRVDVDGRVVPVVRRADDGAQ